MLVSSLLFTMNFFTHPGVFHIQLHCIFVIVRIYIHKRPQYQLTIEFLGGRGDSFQMISVDFGFLLFKSSD